MINVDLFRKRGTILSAVHSFIHSFIRLFFFCVLPSFLQARVTGVPINFLLSRGQQIKVLSQLYRKCKQHGLVVPVRPKMVSDEKYDGATVLDPIKGFYDVPVSA